MHSAEGPRFSREPLAADRERVAGMRVDSMSGLSASGAGARAGPVLPIMTDGGVRVERTGSGASRSETQAVAGDVTPPSACGIITTEECGAVTVTAPSRPSAAVRAVAGGGGMAGLPAIPAARARRALATLAPTWPRRDRRGAGGGRDGARIRPFGNGARDAASVSATPDASCCFPWRRGCRGDPCPGPATGLVRPHLRGSGASRQPPSGRRFLTQDGGEGPSGARPADPLGGAGDG